MKDEKKMSLECVFRWTKGIRREREREKKNSLLDTIREASEGYFKK